MKLNGVYIRVCSSTFKWKIVECNPLPPWLNVPWRFKGAIKQYVIGIGLKRNNNQWLQTVLIFMLGCPHAVCKGEGHVLFRLVTLLIAPTTTSFSAVETLVTAWLEPWLLSNRQYNWQLCRYLYFVGIHS